MRLDPVWMLLVVASANPSAAPQGHGASFQTKKTVAAVQKCLTDKLTQIGEVVALASDADSATLVLRDNSDDPMIIEIAPPSVTVTTRIIHGTRKLVQTCV
jgi:hypothetical protein